QRGGMHLIGGDVGGAEDLAEMLAGDSGEAGAVFGRYAHDHGIGGEVFAFATGHVFGQLVHDAAQHQHGLAVVGQCTAGITAVGTGGHAEGGVTGSTVGDGGNQVGWQAALAFEQHVAPAATGATGRGCEGIEGSSGKQRANQDPFHDYHPV